MTYATIGIILRRRDVGEWDRLYTCYTRAYGKLALIGKGTRRPRAKLASHLEPYAEVDLVAAHGRAVDRITFARAVAPGIRFVTSWEAVQFVAFACECVDQLTRDGERDERVYDLLSSFLTLVASGTGAVSRQLPAGSAALFGTLWDSSGHGVLAVGEDERVRNVSEDASLGHLSVPEEGTRLQRAVAGIEYPATAFSLRLCALLGYTPRMDRCLECRGAPGPAPVTGLPERGGFVCHRCRVSRSTGIALTITDCERIALAAARFSPDPCPGAVEVFAQALVACHAWQPLRTVAVLDGLTGARSRPTMASS